MSTSMTKEQWDAKEAEHCQFWKDVKGETVLPRPYPGSSDVFGALYNAAARSSLALHDLRDVMRAERDDALVHLKRATVEKQGLQDKVKHLEGVLGSLRDVRDDALVHLKRATVEKQGLQDKVKHLEGVLGRLKARIGSLLNDAGVLRAERDDALARYTNAIGNLWAAEYKVLYEASLALVKVVEEGDANVGLRDDDLCRALQALNRVLDGNTP